VQREKKRFKQDEEEFALTHSNLILDFSAQLDACVILEASSLGDVIGLTARFICCLQNKKLQTASHLSTVAKWRKDNPQGARGFQSLDNCHSKSAR